MIIAPEVFLVDVRALASRPGLVAQPPPRARAKLPTDDQAGVLARCALVGTQLLPRLDPDVAFGAADRLGNGLMQVGACALTSFRLGGHGSLPRHKWFREYIRRSWRGPTKVGMGLRIQRHRSKHLLQRDAHQLRDIGHP